jgi:hypothetical protein
MSLFGPVKCCSPVSLDSLEDVLHWEVWNGRSEKVEKMIRKRGRKKSDSSI